MKLTQRLINQKKKENNNIHKFIVNNKEKSSKKEHQNAQRLSQKYIPKLKVNLSCSLKFINKKKNTKVAKKTKNHICFKIIRKNIQKYNSTPKYKNTLIISNLINCRSSHFLAIFKDYLITDYVEEFLRRIYSLNESIERIPKLYNYYKNYLQFFCKPTFIDTYSNIIIKNFGDCHAENFYKNNIEKKNHNNGGLDDKNNNSFSNEMKSNNKNGELIKTIFTKSIKNSIDNINNNEKSSINKNEKEKGNKIINALTDSNNQESTIKYDKNFGNLISEENSLLIMINEMKDNQKKKIKENRMNMKKSLSKNRNHSIYSYKSLLIVNNNINNNIKKTFNNYNKGKMTTYSNIKQNDTVKNIIYSQREPKKLTKLKKKKNIINKNEKINPKNQSVNLNKNNQGSIVVNINININTNENTNGNTNTNGNANGNKNGNKIVNINGNIINNKYKSPKNNQNKRRFPLSPLSPLNLNVLSEKDFSKKILPLSSRRNKDKIKKVNYIKIMKKKKESNNLMVLTSTSRNKKRFDLKKIKSLNSLDIIDIKNKTNNSSNKEIFCYNKKKKSPKKIKYRNINSDTSYNKGKFEFYTRYTTINKTIYSSNKNFGLNNPNCTNSLKSLEKFQKIKDKKSISKRNNVIFSPLQKKVLEKKYYSYKRLENINTNS